jgi:mRNA-degrading endonuclease toxin of MazEF toxin-antitoxin module
VRRGDIWVYRPVIERPGQSRLRLIVSNDALNADESLPYVRGLQVVDEDPGGLLSVRIEPHGWATALSSEMVMRRRLVEQVGIATADEMYNVEVAIAAMYGLPR